MRAVQYTSRFKKDLKRVKRQGKNMTLLKQIITTLANDQPLPKRYRDHALLGNYIGTRECHLQPDWLFIYRYEAENLLVLIRTGSHADLF